MKRGLRVVVKTDAESAIGRGCVLYLGHLRPEIILMPREIGRAAQEYYPQFTWMRLTEGHRDIRQTRDLHEELRAIDITLETDGGVRATESQLQAIATKASERLGPDYDLVVHAVGTDAIHIHAELDPQ